MNLYLPLPKKLPDLEALYCKRYFSIEAWTSFSLGSFQYLPLSIEAWTSFSFGSFSSPVWMFDMPRQWVW
jgi:hypothetical protein